jgi:streptomycin 3"-adenylyltransferase
LAGAPIEQVFPAVPVEDYRRSILLDLEWGARRAHEDPVYLVLNCCRVLAFLSEGKVFSKLEGGTWGMRSLPDDFVLLLEAALGSYQGTADHPVDQSLLASFLDHVKGKCPS